MGKKKTESSTPTTPIIISAVLGTLLVAALGAVCFYKRSRTTEQGPTTGVPTGQVEMTEFARAMPVASAVSSDMNRHQSMKVDEWASHQGFSVPSNNNQDVGGASGGGGGARAEETRPSDVIVEM